MSDEMAELKKRLKEAFEVATKLYQELSNVSAYGTD
jgi:hypothetical protein